MSFMGELAAIGTALAFAATSTLFTLSGRELGSTVVNRTRLLLAIVFIVTIHWLSRGNILPVDAAYSNWYWLGLSGFIGLAMGDASLFQAFVMIGPRLSMLVMALVPVMSTVLAWAFLDEHLTDIQLAGITLTVCGIAWVVAEKNQNGHQTKSSQYRIGLLFAFGGALGQAIGLITAKMGLEEGFPALSGLAIRILAATIAVWAFTMIRGQVMPNFHKIIQHPRATRLLVIGAITGPITGVWLSLIAVQHAPVGIASTLMALTPIFLLPIAYFVFHDKITNRTVAGTIVAFVGTALLFL